MADADDIEGSTPEEVIAAGGVSKSRRSGHSSRTGQRRRRGADPKRSQSSPARFPNNSSSSEMEDEDDDEARPLMKKSPTMPASGEQPEVSTTPKPALRRRSRARKEAQEKSEENARLKTVQPEPVQPESVQPEAVQPENVQSEAVQPETVQSPEPTVVQEVQPEETEPTAKEEKVNDGSWWKYWPSWGKKRSRSAEPRPPAGEEQAASPRRMSLNEAEEEPSVKPILRKRHKKKEEKTPISLGVNDSSDELWGPTGSSEPLLPAAPDEPVTRAVIRGSSEDATVKHSFKDFIKEAKIEYVRFVKDHPEDSRIMKLLRNRCICDLIILTIFCGLGAFLFKFTEGTFESFYKCGVKRVKRDFIDELWRNSHFLKEDEWKSKARRKLMDFENQLQEAFEAGLTSYSGQRSWSFINSVIYSFTVVSTIGYGHIAPSTTTGRALTIVYAIIGIPMFLILLADFGKMFTRGIKWVWAFVRRLYYTGSCKKVRKTGPVQEVMKGVQVMYDIATFRRPSQTEDGAEAEGQMPEGDEGGPAPHSPISGEPPSTPAPSNFAIDDEFNIPITVAIFILLAYIFCGACVFYIWERSWSFFESFYFVFISMSTIGFGDFVPQVLSRICIPLPSWGFLFPHMLVGYVRTGTLRDMGLCGLGPSGSRQHNKMYMMASIVYLAFGLALTTMCINVVQEKLSDTFRQATAKIGATIGLKVSEEDGSVTPATPANVELAQVHKSPSQS